MKRLLPALSDPADTPSPSPPEPTFSTHRPNFSYFYIGSGFLFFAFSAYLYLRTHPLIRV